MGLIFIGSTDLLSGDRTSGFIGPVLRWIKDQSMVATRFGSAWDVGVDALGAPLGIGLAWWRSRRQRRG